MMLLAVDVGNTRTKVGWFQGESLRGDEHFPTGGLVAREVAAGLRARGVKPDAAALCSVVPDATEEWRGALAEAVGEPLVVQGDSEIGITNHYAPPSALGPDRLLGALAARALHGAPVIVVSLGTATVVDAVSPAGEFMGGAIAPGIETSLEALARRAARLLPVRFEVAPRATATDTRAAMIAGAYFGALGQVRELLSRVRAEMGEQAPAVITGGRAELLARELDDVAGVEPALTLIGLRLAWEHVSRQADPAREKPGSAH